MKITKKQLVCLIREHLIQERMDSDVYKIVIRALNQGGPMTHQELLAHVLHEFPNTSDEDIDEYIDTFEDDGEIIFDATSQKYY